jgi:hypothetical protein
MYTSRAGVYPQQCTKLSIHKPNVLSDPLITKKRIKYY